MSLLTPEIGLLFWMIVAFGVVFFVLAKFGFPIITQMVDERKKYIDESMVSHAPEIVEEGAEEEPEVALSDDRPTEKFEQISIFDDDD